MNTLYIAGDSFATISKLQPESTSWSELLAKELGCDLQNVSRSAASNVSIAIQLDYILKQCSSSDYIVVLLTDNYRKTFPNIDKDIDDAINSGKINLLSGHSLKDQQKNLSKIEFSDDPYLITTTITRALLSESDVDAQTTLDYFKKYFSMYLQRFEDISILSGMFFKILKKTNNLFVCSGGFDNESFGSWLNNKKIREKYKETKFYETMDIVSPELFGLEKENFINLTQKQMLRFGSYPDSCNHLSSEGHHKVYRFIYGHICTIQNLYKLANKYK